MPAFFTADLHLGREGAIGFGGRPFRIVAEHGCGLIDRWNNRVGPDDDIYGLGGFARGASARALSRMSSDRRGPKYRSGPLRHIAIVWGRNPSCAASFLNDAFKRCSAPQTACVARP